MLLLPIDEVSETDSSKEFSAREEAAFLTASPALLIRLVKNAMWSFLHGQPGDLVEQPKPGCFSNHVALKRLPRKSICIVSISGS